MIINNKFNYKPLERKDSPDGRKYVTWDGEILPSVTTILSSTKDMTYINEWKKSIGEEKAEAIKEEAAHLGTEMHKNLEYYLLGKPKEGSFLSKALADLIIKKGLCRVSEVWGFEVGLFAAKLYAGTTDCIGVHDGSPAIIDFKNSRDKKEKSYIQDYFLQCAAYAHAHNEMFGTNISKGVIMIATRDAKYQEFVFEGDEFAHYHALWVNKLLAFYEK